MRFPAKPVHPEHAHVDEDYHDWEMRSGTTRHAYIGEKWVYKEPHQGSYWGAEQNAIEAAVYAMQRQGEDVRVPVAECYLLPDGVLKMRRVVTIYDWTHDPDAPMAAHKYPDWVVYVDSNQIGYDEDGNIVAFDI